MARCKYCHREISRVRDADICPYCGGVKPIDDDFRTLDVTSVIDPVKGQYKTYRSRSRKTAALLCALLGYFGVHRFYLYYPLRGFLCIAITLALVGGVGSILAFVAKMPIWLSYLIPFLAVWIFYVIFSFLLKGQNSLKDGRGEFTR